MAAWVVGMTAAAAAAAGATAPTVSTTCGPVAGTTAAGGGVHAYRGIPYAAPPTGDNRFAPTVPQTKGGAGCWSGTLNATTEPPMCYQSNALDPSAKPTGSEDCLFLDVYTPNATATAGGGRGYGVFAFIHGGDLTGGSAAAYDLANFSAAQGVVAVVLQYRLGPFGFMATAELSAEDPRKTSGNYGFLDQQEALRWVQKNIANFGGNAANVTVFGQSSGGTSVFALLSSPASHGLFSSAISLSGSPNITMDLHSAEAANAQFVSNAGCDKAPGGAAGVVKCLRGLNATAVMAAQPKLWTAFPNIFGIPSDPKGLAMPPLAIVDGATVTMPVAQALSSGLVDVPLIVQSMAEEPDLLPAKIVYNMSVSQFRDWLDPHMAKFGSMFAEEALVNYISPLAVNPQKAYDQISADIGVTCGNNVLAAAAGTGFRSNVYQGYVTQGPSKPVAAIPDGYSPRYAFHMWDLIAACGLWDFFEAYSGTAYAPSTADAALGATIAASWKALNAHGELPASMNWATVSSAPGFPDSQAQGIVTSHVATVTNNKATTCRWWGTHGVGKLFWWCD
uniref:Carboxylic ester hydrolase n=1 Tax=Bicosoecida sp. CB-2014 TaxID=1486930 RepID=A0A7S1CAD9_9STRA